MTPTTREKLAAMGVSAEKLARGDMVRLARELGVSPQRIHQLLPRTPAKVPAGVAVGDKVDSRLACRLLGVGRSWFYAQVAPHLDAYPADWSALRPKRRQPEQMTEGRPAMWRSKLYRRAQLQELVDLRARMLAEADTRYVPWLKVLATWRASRTDASKGSS